MEVQRGAVRKANLIRRGRAGVLWSLAVFLALQIGFHPLSRWWPQLRDAEYGNKLTMLRAHVAGKTARQPLILTFGSSLTAMGINPRMLTSCRPKVPDGPILYNFAINSRGPMVQLMCLRRLLDEGFRPDWVLVEAMPFFLFEPINRQDAGEFFPANRLEKQDLSVLAHYRENTHHLRAQWRTIQICPWYSYRVNIQNWLMHDWIPTKKQRFHLWTNTDEWGWELHTPSINYFKHYKGPDIQHYFEGRLDECNNSQFSENIRQALREMVDICKEKKIGVIVVRMPESTWLRNGYSPALREKLDQYFERLHQETDAPVVNASDWMDDGDFVEGWHISPAGAPIFTKRLEEEVLKPLIAGKKS